MAPRCPPGQADLLEPTPSGPSDRRVMVTGGAGFLGRSGRRSSRGRRRRARSSCPRSADYDLRTPGWRPSGARGRPAGRRHPPRGRRRRHRRQPGEPGPVLLRERDHGHPAHGGGAAGRRRASSSTIGTVCSYPKFTPVPVPARTTSGTATRRRRTPRTAWPRRCSSSRARPTAQQYGFNVDPPDPGQPVRPGRQLRPGVSSHVIPALIKKCVDARERGRRPRSRSGAPGARRASSCTSRTPPRASSWPAERYDDPDPVNLGVGPRDHHPRPGRADRAS